MVKNWPKPIFIRGIQVFLDFTNFYYYFIQSSGKIDASLTLMLKTSQKWVMQLLMDVTDNEFGEGDCGKDK